MRAVGPIYKSGEYTISVCDGGRGWGDAVGGGGWTELLEPPVQ